MAWLKCHLTTNPVGFIERIPIWAHLPCHCQYNIYSMKHASDTRFFTISGHFTICHMSPHLYIQSIHECRLDFPFAGDYNNRLCPQRALRLLCGRLSLQIASIEAISPCPLPPTWWICTHSKSRSNAVDRASHSLEPIESRPLFGQRALPSTLIWYWETCSGEAKRTDGCTARRE